MTSLPQGVRVREDFSDKGMFRLRAEAGVEVSWGRAGEEVFCAVGTAVEEEEGWSSLRGKT